LSQPASHIARIHILTVLLWLPILFFDFTGQTSLREIAASPVLTKALGLAVAVLLWVIIGSALTIALVIGRLDGTFDDSLGRSSNWFVDSITIMTCTMALFLLRPLRFYIAEMIWAPPGLRLLVLPVIAAVLSCALITLGVLIAPWLRRWPWQALLPAALVLSWLLLLGRRLGVLSQPARALLVLPSVVALGVLLVFHKKNGLRPLLAAFGIGLMGPIAIVLLIGSGTTHSVVETPSSASPAPSFNVLLLVIDTWRADHTSAGGSHSDTSPMLRELAATGASTLFRQATSAAPATVPSIKSVFTSRYPSSWGIENLGKVPPPGVWTLPRAFKESRYRTAAFSSNGVVDGPGFAGGFDTFWSATGVTMYREFFCLYNLLSNHDFWHMHEVLDRFTLAKVRGETVRKLARSWIARHRDGPFFLYLHVNEPHWPYEKHGHKLVPSARGAKPLFYADLLPGRLASGAAKLLRGSPALAEMIGRYDEEVKEADTILSRVLLDLDDLGVDSSTMLIVIGDHGEEFFEHGSFSHGHDVYQEQIHVPMLVRWPASEAFASMPKVIDRPVSLVDILPTLTDYLRLVRPDEASARWVGESMRGYLEGTVEKYRPIWVETQFGGEVRAAYREGSLKVRLELDSAAFPIGRLESRVFDLETDPTESHPLPEDDPRVEALVARARRHAMSRVPSWSDGKSDQGHTDDQDEALERLRSLGYID